jgi:hypothetical protein
LPEHVSITDPDIHEPKGVVSADSGEVYIADGLGSGAWGQVLPSQTGNSGKILTTNGTAPSWTAPIGIKARATISSGTLSTNTVSNDFNVATCTQVSGVYTITFDSAIGTNYQVLVSQTVVGTNADSGMSTTIVKTTNDVKITFRRGTGGVGLVGGFDLVIVG